jgi:ABC-type antimicrobial peptide transport system permease subunit
MRPSLVGAALGIVASWWTTRLLGAFVFNVGPHNVRIWTIAVFGLSAVAAFAAWLPARRVANADPMEVLRAE